MSESSAQHGPTPPGRTPDIPGLPPGVPDPALGEYAARQAVALTDAERWPTLSAPGFARLQAVREHPRAPVWVHECGDRLDGADHVHLTRTAADLDARRAGQHSRRPGGPAARAGTDPVEPAWVRPFLERVQATVPRYRAIARVEGRRPRTLTDFLPVSRADLARSVAAFVPVDVPLDRVLEGSSSGSTGASLVVPLHPLSTATEVVLLRDLAAQVGVTWDPDPGRLALANVVDQRAAFTYVSALTALTALVPAEDDEVMMARVNLHPTAWRDVADREAFFTAMDPQVLSSSPLPLLALAELGLDIAPDVVFSGAAHLTPAARARLRAEWDVPVVDVYGTRETGLVAADLGGGEGATEHVVLPRRILVEILDEAGSPVPDGTRGEVTVTVDDNPYLPLVRYRTGDTASLRRDVGADGRPVTVIVGLEGRTAVRFLTSGGAWVPSVDATQVLQAYGVAAWHLHQDAEGTVRLTVLRGWRRTAGQSSGAAGVGGRASDPSADAAADAVGRLLGRPVELSVLDEVHDLAAGAKRRFTSDLPHEAGRARSG